MKFSFLVHFILVLNSSYIPGTGISGKILKVKIKCRPCMIILSKILQILIKFTPFAIVIFNFLYKNFHFCSKIKFFGHLEVWDLLNINSNYPSSVMCPTLCPLLCPVGHIFLKVGHFFGTFYVGEPLKLRNSMTKVLESYFRNRDSPNHGNLLKFPVW